MDMTKFLSQMKIMTEQEKKLTENFLKSIYSKNVEDFTKFIQNEGKNINYN